MEKCGAVNEIYEGNFRILVRKGINENAMIYKSKIAVLCLFNEDLKKGFGGKYYTETIENYLKLMELRKVIDYFRKLHNLVEGEPTLQRKRINTNLILKIRGLYLQYGVEIIEIVSVVLFLILMFL